MNILKYCQAGLMSVLLLTGCAKEPLNAECDIEGATLTTPDEVRDVLITNDAVNIKVSNYCDMTSLAPVFELTPGATVNPPSGTYRDFTTPQIYTVTSEDKKWHKDYVVTIDYMNPPLKYGFENIELQQYGNTNYYYDVFVEYKTDADGNPIYNGGEPVVDFRWASGNEGFAWTGYGKEPDDYPTFQVADSRDGGKCLCLITRKTGTLANMYNKPLAAGNLFMGSFNMGEALMTPLKSTHFGMAFTQVPIAIEGYYKYTPGEIYCELDKSAKDKLKPIPGKQDEFNVIGVMFDNTMTEKGYLDATNMTSEDNEAIISVATIADADRVPADDWTFFRVDFVTRPGKVVDIEKLKKGNYSIFLVFTSSIKGDYFSGAEGSTLYVDDVELICDNPTE